MSVESPQKPSGEPPPESDNRRISIDSASTEASGETAASDNSLKEELSDPEILVKRNKASLKNKLALGAEAAINKAAKIVANNQGRARLQCLSVFIFCTALSLAFALHIYFLNDPMGAPPTKEANWAASSLLLLLLINACFSTSGFVIIYLKFSHLVVGFVYLTMLTSMEFYTTIVVSKAVVTIQKGTFDDIKAYSKEHYKQYHLIPDYVAHYEIQGNCCGWGEPNRKFEAWPTLLETNDLPDTCCINQFYGCGRDAVPRTVPSGHMMFLSSAEYASLFSSSRDQVDTEFLDNDHSTLSKVIRTFPARDGIPDELLRLLDELTDAPMFYYLGEEFAAEGTTIVHVYKSLGQIENYRLKGIIKHDTCNTDQILNDTKFHTMFVLIYGCVQLMLCILMSFVFWYYFLENRAEIFAAEPLPGDFTTLQMERFCLDDQFEAIIQERNRIEKLRELREQEKEEERKRKELLAEAAAKMLESSEAADKPEEKGTTETGQS